MFSRWTPTKGIIPVMNHRIHRFPGILFWLILGIIFLASVAFSGGQGTTTVTTAGTPVRLLASPVTKAVGCTITAAAGNTGTIYVGFTSAVSASSGIGTPLGPPTTAGQPGASYTCMPVGNTAAFSLSSVWLDTTHSGDKVNFSWF